MAYKTDGIGPSLCDWRDDEDYRKSMAADEAALEMDRGYALWERIAYCDRKTKIGKEAIQEVMNDALSQLYDSEAAIERFNHALFCLLSNPSDLDAMLDFQALVGAYVKFAARPQYLPATRLAA